MTEIEKFRWTGPFHRLFPAQVERELRAAVARPRREQEPVEVVEARARAARFQRERRRLDGALPVVREDLGRRALVAAANLGKKRVRNS